MIPNAKTEARENAPPVKALAHLEDLQRFALEAATNFLGQHLVEEP